MQDSKGKSKLFWNDKTLHTLKQRNSSCMQCFVFCFFYIYIVLCYCTSTSCSVLKASWSSLLSNFKCVNNFGCTLLLCHKNKQQRNRYEQVLYDQVNVTIYYVINLKNGLLLMKTRYDLYIYIIIIIIFIIIPFF